MKLIFWHSDKPRERILAAAFADGIRTAGFGDEIELRPLQPQIDAIDCDIACMVGVKSRDLFRAYWSKGIHTLYFDKGYTRRASPGAVKLWEYWRVAVDGHQPTKTLMKWQRPYDRFEALNIDIAKPWHSNKGDHILIAGSSQKYHDFYGLREPTQWTQKLIRSIREITDAPIIYRPKPSWSEAVPIEGTEFSHPHGLGESIDDALSRSKLMITHGSNACFEAVLAGVPCIILGEAVAKPISSTELAAIDSPHLATIGERVQWFANLAYCQWTLSEFASGLPWKYIRPQFYG